MIKLLMFDLDGTLIHSAPDIINTTNTLLKRRGLEPLPDSIITTAIGEGLKSFVLDLFPETKDDPEVMRRIEAEFMELYDQNLLVQTTVYEGVEDFLDSCTRQIAIITNKMERYALKTVHHLPLRRFPWLHVLGADSLAARKPDPLPLLETMKKAGVEPHECLMIGDGIPDMQAAKSAGVRSVAIEFGYGPMPRLIELGATYRIGHYRDLGALLTALDKDTDTTAFRCT